MWLAKFKVYGIIEHADLTKLMDYAEDLFGMDQELDYIESPDGERYVSWADAIRG